MLEGGKRRRRWRRRMGEGDRRVFLGSGNPTEETGLRQTSRRVAGSAQRAEAGDPRLFGRENEAKTRGKTQRRQGPVVFLGEAGSRAIRAPVMLRGWRRGGEQLRAGSLNGLEAGGGVEAQPVNLVGRKGRTTLDNWTGKADRNKRVWPVGGRNQQTEDKRSTCRRHGGGRSIGDWA